MKVITITFKIEIDEEEEDITEERVKDYIKEMFADVDLDIEYLKVETKYDK